MPRCEGIRRGAEIQGLFQQGNRDERPSFVVLWQPRVEGRRVAFAVSRKVGSAVARNRARRRLREVYRLEQEALQIPISAVFVARSGVLARTFAELREEMRRALEMLGRGPRNARPGHRESSA